MTEGGSNPSAAPKLTRQSPRIITMEKEISVTINLSDRMVGIPLGQRILLAKALDYYIENHRTMIPTPSMEQEHERSDMKTLRILVRNYEINVEITPQQRETFISRHGFMDFPLFF